MENTPPMIKSPSIENAGEDAVARGIHLTGGSLVMDSLKTKTVFLSNKLKPNTRMVKTGDVAIPKISSSKFVFLLYITSLLILQRQTPPSSYVLSKSFFLTTDYIYLQSIFPL